MLDAGTPSQVAVTRLRRSLVNDTGLDKKSLSFMGYWKDGVVTD